MALHPYYGTFNKCSLEISDIPSEYLHFAGLISTFYLNQLAEEVSNSIHVFLKIRFL